MTESSTSQLHLLATRAAASYEKVWVAVKASFSSNAGLICWCVLSPHQSRIGQPQCLSCGSCPCHTSSWTRPTTVRNPMASFRRCCTLRWLRGENSALAVDFFLEPVLQPSARPFAPFFQYFHLYFAQRARSIVLRGHWSFRATVTLSSDEEPITTPLLSEICWECQDAPGSITPDQPGQHPPTARRPPARPAIEPDWPDAG